jgi:3-oxoacyl-[acyl-carrier-protein] synthase II
MKRRVVITGMGAVTPLGLGARVLFERWAAGESGIADGLGRCSEFDSAVGARGDGTARFVRLAAIAAIEALSQAGWQAGLPFPAERIACVLGTGVGALDLTEEATLRRCPERTADVAVPVIMPNDGAAAIALRFGLRGPAYPLQSACAAGAHAIGEAGRLIAAGSVDAALAGGSEASITPLPLAAFSAMGAMSRVGVSRPFDVRRDGFVMGEGAGVLVLEAAECARRRGAVVLGELAGYGSTDDAHHLTAPEPEGVGAARAIELALADAGLGAGDLAYVNAHGTGTPLNDVCETLALKRALGAEVAARVPVSSTKSAIGHLIGAAGAVEAVVTVAALNARLAPPTLNLEQPDPVLDLDFVPGAARVLPAANGRPLAAISNSFGFGGHNAVLCLKTP